MKLDGILGQEHLKKRSMIQLKKKFSHNLKFLLIETVMAGLTLPSKLQEDYWKLTKITKEKF